MDELVPGIEFAALDEVHHTAGEGPGGRMFAALFFQEFLSYGSGAIVAAIGDTTEFASRAAFAHFIEECLLKQALEHRRDALLFVPGKDGERHGDGCGLTFVATH